MGSHQSKLIVGGLVLAGAGVLTWALLSGSEKRSRVETMTSKELVAVLKDIADSQVEMKKLLRDLTKDMIQKSMYDFTEVYERVNTSQPEDPLKKCGLSMMELDQLLDLHQNDPEVRTAIARVMGVTGGLNGEGEDEEEGEKEDGAVQPRAGDLSPNSLKALNDAKQVSVQQVVDVHKYMLEQLKEVVRQYEAAPNKDALNMKTVTIAAQAICGAKVEAKYKLSSEAIEQAVMVHHTALGNDTAFAMLNMEMQMTMTRLMGGPGAEMDPMARVMGM